MTTEYIVYMGINLSAFILIISLLILTLFSGDLKKRIYFLFFLNVLLTFLGMMSDIFIELMHGKTSPFIDIAVRVLNAFSYCLVGLELIIFAYYLYEYFSTKATVSKKPFQLLALIGAADFLLAIIASITNLYSRFDEFNNFIQQDTYWISELLPSLALLICAGITLKHIQILKAREWISLLLYAVMPIICYVIGLLNNNLSLAYVGAVLTLFLIYINIQVELKTDFLEQEATLAENRIAIMLRQIQPHFLYNTLNTISAMIPSNPEKAQNLVETFSVYLRQNMDSLTQNRPIPFEKELDHTRLYLDIEKQRFTERLNVEYNLEVINFAIPVLTVQPLVENAVRHGVTKKREGGTVTISTGREFGTIRIVISDDGIGFEQSLSKNDGNSHIGIDNVRQRIETQCRGTLTIESKSGGGTICTITIPEEGNLYESNSSR